MISASISGDGSGAEVTVESGVFESHMPRVAPPGVIFLTGKNIGVNSEDEIVDGSGYVLPLLPKGNEAYGWHARGRDDGEMYRIMRPDSIESLHDPRLFSHSLSVSDTGYGYNDPIRLHVTAGPSGSSGGRAVPWITFDGKVEAIGPTSAGYGYESPPQLTLYPAAGSATATIAGPLGKVKVTSAGSGYRVPPKVKFSGDGVHATASCTLNASGGVADVKIVDGGRYRNTPPAVQFQPVVEVESISITSAGDGYTSSTKVFIGGGGGVGAEASVEIKYKVKSIEVLSGGEGYTTAPQVLIEGGASATATISDGKVSEIQVTDQGSGYGSPPAVILDGGGGGGATAVATMTGYVNKVTLLKRGEGYVQSPQVVFHDGGGSGAAAVASIAAVGSGAAATAHINGSVIFCTHTGETSGLQREPQVTVSASTNYIIQDSLQALSEGKTTQAAHDALVKQASAVIKTRISGRVTSAGVSSGGEMYGDIYASPTTMNRKFASVAIIPTAYQRSGYQLRFHGEVSPDGVIQQLAPEAPSYLENAVFVRKPKIVMMDAPDAEAYTCLLHAGSVIIGSTTAVAGNTRYTHVYNGLRYFVPSGGKPGGMCFTGAIEGLSSGVFGGYYSTMPAIAIEDEVGSGAAFSFGADRWLNGIPTNSGAGYTLNARLKITGGTPSAWSNKATAVAVLTNGTVSQVNVTSPGAGYTSSRTTILFCGGGGSGAAAVPLSYTATRGIQKIAVTNAGGGYTSPPEVVIVDGERPFEESEIGAFYASSAIPGSYVRLKNAKLEYVFEPEKKQYTLTTPLGLIPPSMGGAFMPLFEGGHIESAVWRFLNRYQVAMRPFSTPTVTPESYLFTGTGNREAALKVTHWGWANCYSGKCIKEYRPDE